MKFGKRAAVIIFMVCLACISVYAGVSMNVRNMEQVQEYIGGEVLSQGISGIVAEAARRCGVELSEADKGSGCGIELSEADKGGGSLSGAAESTEASAVAEDYLNLSDIRNMEAGSILEMETLRADMAESLFYSEELSPEVQQRIVGTSYQENDNISLEELRYLRILHVGFDGQTHIGELLVNQSIAADVLEIMAELYENGYAIEKMALVDNYGADDEQSMEDNNTSAFNYREIAGSSKLSRHSLGLAIDINPLYNPCVKNGGTSISPVNAGDYADRSQLFAHKIDEKDLCYQLFTEHGFTWGGHWNSLKDYQHFEK